jgi:hypothetical protein
MAETKVPAPEEQPPSASDDANPTASHSRVQSALSWTARGVRFVVVAAIWVIVPLAGVAVMLNALPYHAKASGIEFQVRGTLLANPGLSADTTLGSWQFPHVDGLPIGAHISPQDVDVFQLATAANNDGTGFAQSLQADIKKQIPHIVWWLAGVSVL